MGDLDVLKQDKELFPDGYELYGRMGHADIMGDAKEGLLALEDVEIGDDHPIGLLLAGFSDTKGLVIAFDSDKQELGRKEFPISHDTSFGLDVEDTGSLDDAANELILEVLRGDE